MRLTRFLAACTVAMVMSCATAPSGTGPLRPRSAAASSKLTETISLAATTRSTAQQVGYVSTIGFSVRTTGTASGTWSVQYSNDFIWGVDDPTSDAKWDTYPLTTTPAPAAGSPQVFGIAIDTYEFTWVRIKFTSSGGTGSGTVITELKGY